jgi:N-methylhydantoinase A
VPDRVAVDRRGGPAAGERQAYFGPEAGWLPARVLARGDVAKPVTGPVVIEEYDATCVVPPGARASLDAWGNIVIELS